MILDSLISFLAGLGLFFIGVKGLGSNMGQLAGRRLRHWVARSIDNPLLAALIGLISGALTQSTNAVTVIQMCIRDRSTSVARRERLRHGLSAKMKRIFGKSA